MSLCIDVINKDLLWLTGNISVGPIYIEHQYKAVAELIFTRRKKIADRKSRSAIFLSRTSFSALEAERSKKYMSNTYRLFGRIFGGLALNYFVEQSRTISEQIQNKIHLSAVSVVMDFL